MKTLKGTALYCGIGYGTEKMKKHLDDAAAVGMNAVFTSLQLPEADVEATLRDFPIMAKEAHERGMLVAADIAARTATKFGIQLSDLLAIKQLGVDIMRLDGGYNDEEIAALTRNELGMVIMLNAAQERRLENICSFEMNKDLVLCCHNYYPMKYTGLTRAEAKAKNDVIHKYGLRVAGFCSSSTHQRIGCGLGLPTVEEMRGMDVFAAAQEMRLLGFDDIFFGDDLADKREMSTLVEALNGPVTFRMKPLIDDPVISWLDGRVLYQIGNNLEKIVRSSFCHKPSIYDGDTEVGLGGERKKGDVTLCKKALLRYAGEIQLCRTDLPDDPDIGIIGHIIDEDIPLLENFKTDDAWGPPFRMKII